MALLELLLIVAAAQSPAPAAQASPPAGITRTDLQRHDLSMEGWAAVQTRVDFAPGAVAPRHVHPGAEIVYVLQGRLEYRLEGEPRVTLKSGDVLFIPEGKPHSVENVGLESASELATYIVKKDAPVAVPLP